MFVSPILHHNLFTYSSLVGGPLGFLHICVHVNNAAINLGVCIFCANA